MYCYSALYWKVWYCDCNGKSIAALGGFPGFPCVSSHAYQYSIVLVPPLFSIHPHYIHTYMYVCMYACMYVPLLLTWQLSIHIQCTVVQKGVSYSVTNSDYQI